MRAYSASTVIRRTSNAILKSFFEHEKCMTSVDFERDKLYEIQEAFRLLKESDRMRVESIMRNVFVFANGGTATSRLFAEVNNYELEAECKIITDPSASEKSLYDKVFMVYLNYPDIWKKACFFIEADMMQNRFWTRYANLPNMHPRTDKPSLDAFGKAISDFFWKKQIRGNKFHVQYEQRSEKEHYYLVFLSDFSNTYDVFEPDNDEMVSRSESRTLSMAIVFDEERHTLEINAHGGREVYDTVALLFSSIILVSELNMQQTIISNYRLDQLLLPENKLMPIPECGVMSVRIASMKITYNRGNKRRQHVINLNSTDDSLYEEISMFSEDKNVSNIHIRFVDIILGVLLNGIMTEMSIKVFEKSCDLRSASDELRLIGNNYIQKVGIDEQQYLNLF